MTTLKYLLFTVILLVLSACGSNVDLSKKPVDEIVKNLNQVKDFSVILYDMDTEGSFFKKYKHQYQIIQGDSSSGGPKEEITDWYEVSKENFMANINNMGMEIVSKQDGKLDKTVSPPGYGSYVGNPAYGHWTQSNGTSFWAFYGQYAFMSSMFRMMTYPVTMSYWNDYRTNYYGTGRSYYGPSTGTGTYMYGTNSQFNNGRTTSRWNSNTSNNSFRSRVQGATSKSTRSSSRFSPSSRTRSSGFGK
jgi:hypothetical protein